MAQIKPYKRGNKQLYMVVGYLGVDEYGKQKNIEKRGFKTKKEAQLFYKKKKLDFESGNYFEDNKLLTYEKVYKEWHRQYKNTVKESTLVKTEQIFRDHILPAFGKLRMNKISSNHIQKTVDEWHVQFKKYRTVFNYTNRIFKYAIFQGYLVKNPCERVFVPTKKLEYDTVNTRVKDFYNKTELKEFMVALDDYGYPMWKVFFRLLAYSGIRRGEALSLTWNDIDFNNMLLNVDKTLAEGIERKSIIQSPKSKSSIRNIILDEETLNILKEWKYTQAELLLGFGFNAMKPNQLIFSKYIDNSYLNLSTPRNRLVSICKKYDLPFINIHGFRHTHASLLFEADVPMQDVKERLGHSSIIMTQDVYTHVTDDSKNKSAEKFAKYIEL